MRFRKSYRKILRKFLVIGDQYLFKFQIKFMKKWKKILGKLLNKIYENYGENIGKMEYFLKKLVIVMSAIHYARTTTKKKIGKNLA